MNNCLVTKLKAKVQNDELNYFGMMKIRATATDNSAGFLITSRWGNKLDIKSKTPFSLYKYSANAIGDVIATNVTSYTWTNNTVGYENAFITVPNDGIEHIYYVSKYNINGIMSNNSFSKDLKVRLVFDIEEILYANSMHSIWSGIEGTIKELPTTSLKRFSVWGTSAIGDLTPTVNKNKIQHFSISNTAIGLDLDQLNGECGQNLNSWYLQTNRNVRGDLYNWLQRIHDSGRVSGTANINIAYTSATYNGQSPKISNYVVTFTSDGFTVA